MRGSPFGLQTTGSSPVSTWRALRPGDRISVFKIDPGTGERLGLLATATVGNGRWVDLPEPIIVRAGKAFVAVPEKEE